MNAFPKLWNPRILLALVISVLCAPGSRVSLSAQEQPSASGGAEASYKSVAHVRTWVVLGEVTSKDTYSLSWSSQKSKGSGEGDVHLLFSKLKGCWRSGFSKGYFQVPAGRCRFTLMRDGVPGTKAAELEENFEKGSAYSVLAVMENGVPVLRLVHETPLLPGQEGIYVFNLLQESPLKVQVGEGAAVPVPYSTERPFIVPAAQFGRKPVTLIYPTKRKAEISREIDYSEGGRVSAVFMRNEHSQPSIFIYPAAP